VAETEAAERPFAETPASGREGKKSIWNVALTPIVLALLGLVLLPVALVLYPSSTQTSAPGYSRLGVLTQLHISFIRYFAVQVSSTTAEIEVVVTEAPNQTVANTSAILTVSPPSGIKFRTCPRKSCRGVGGLLQSETWTTPLVFNRLSAAAVFFVTAQSLGVSYNQVDAMAAFPDVYYSGYTSNISPELLVAYHIPATASYDWSGTPAAALPGAFAGWTEPLTGIDTPAKIAVGINESRQSSDSHLTFLAGALIGVAGGALVGAIQELVGNLVKRRE
jgi:hypothetical protein